MHFARLQKLLVLLVTVLTIAGCATPAAPATPRTATTAPTPVNAIVTQAPLSTATPSLTVTPLVTATPTAAVNDLPGNTTAYQDAVAGFKINYPSTWTLQDASPQAKQAGRGYYATMLSWSQQTPYAGEIPSGGTMVQITVTQWEPLDLNQYVAMRKAAWAAVPVPIVLEEEWTLAGGVKAVRLSLKSDKGVTFVLLTLINKRFLTVSGEGDLELVAQIARTLRPIGIARTNAPANPMPGAATGRILFTSKRDGKMQLYTMNTDGSNPTRLTNLQDWNGFPSPSPDGAHIAFISETHDANGWPKDQAIYVIKSDGSNLVNLLPDPAPDIAPAWSPDGALIAFTSAREGDRFRRAVYVIRPDGTGLKKLIDNGDALAWSPDGKQIAFISDRDSPGTFQVYVMGADGGGVRQLTNSPKRGNAAGVGAPVWSPDGARIAFPSDRDGNREIYLMNADGSNQVNLTNHRAYDDSPAWSPDGKRIAFVSDRGGKPGVYVMSADGSNVTVLSKSLANAFSPRWSLDGTGLVFVSDDGSENQDVYWVSADGAGLINLTQNPAQDTFPVWLP